MPTSAAPHLTPLIGRDEELEGVLGALADSRLVTLTGAGGSGKTRLALEVVRRQAHPDDDPVAWVDLAPLSDPHRIAQQVARALGVAEEIPGGSVDSLLQLLGDGARLVALDNCEHLVDACAQVASRLLEARPGLRILATSREPLGISGERAWLVPPLSVPSPGSDWTAVAEADAVRLFVDRARDADAGFAVTPGNAEAVAEICRRLDGIPLALELAAARTRVLSVEQIRDRLDDAFRLLTAGRRGAIPRHRTLGAAVEWSHDLLPPEARALLRRLSVFRGGFTLDGAAAVGGESEGVDALDILDEVARLVDRSLVQVEEVDGAVRYSLLETIRQFAHGRLEESGEGEEVRRRHTFFYGAMVEAVAPQLTGKARKAHVHLLSDEVENLRAALTWSRLHARELHLRMVGGLWWFWYSTRHWLEAGEWLTGALALPEALEPGDRRAQLLFSAGALATLQGRVEDGRPLLEEAIRLCEELGDGRLAAYSRNYLAMGYAQRRDVEGGPVASQTLEWFREHDDPYGLRLTLLMNALYAQFQGDGEAADRFSQEAVEVARGLGQDRDLAIALQNWSLLWAVRGRYDRAEPLAVESLAALRQDPSYLFLARGLDFMGEVAGVRGDPRGAARLMGLAAALRESIGAVPFGIDAARLKTLVSRIQAELGEAEYRRAREEGATLSWEKVVEEMLAAHGAAPADPARAAAGLPRPPAGDELLAEASVPLTAPAAAPPAELPHEPSPGATSKPAGQSTEPRPALRIRTLGEFRLELEEDPPGAQSWAYARPKELLLLLLLNPRGVTRDGIGEAIWPDATPPQVKNSFHVTMHHLRKRLGDPGWIQLEGDRYRLHRSRGVEWDAERFEEALERATRETPPGPARIQAIRDALALYQGDLLEESRSGRWLEDARDHYRRLHSDGWVALARSLEAMGEVEEALEAWQQVTRLEPYHEEAHRGLMRSWARTGGRDRAVQHFHRLQALLREGLEAEPEPETLLLHRTLLDGTLPD